LVFFNDSPSYHGTSYFKVSSSGTLSIAITPIDAAAASNGELAVATLPTVAGGGLAVAWTASNGNINVATFNTSMVLQTSGVMVSFAGPTTQANSPLLPFLNTVRPAIASYITFNATGQLGIIGSFVQKYTPIGVYISGAVAGQKAVVQYNGNVSLSASFVQPYNIDTRYSTPPGQRMSIVGNSATLLGIQSSTSRNIN
jgi:hypothetical protein